MQLQDILYSQGFGTRRICAGLIQQGRVQVYQDDPADSQGRCQIPVTVTQASTEVPAKRLRFKVCGDDWVYHERAYLMLHKPAAFECSHKPSTYPSVYTLLPSPLRMRPQKKAIQGVQAVGRLDQDTTGLLLLTDDGQWVHRLSSPRHHLPKVYEVSLKHPADDVQMDRLLTGVVLDDSPDPVRASACCAVSPCHLRLTLTQGKYHQVKRMVAAVGNRVNALHRSQIGGLRLPDTLAPGQWQWLGADDLAALNAIS